MRKITGSICAKMAAWIGITLSAVVFVGSVLGATVMWEGGIYENSRENLQEQIFETGAAGQYAVCALDNWINHGQKLMDVPYFHYGIIKAEEIDNLDLNQDSTYEGRNFTEQVSSEDLYTFFYQVTEKTEFSYSGTLWGGYAVYDDHAPTYTTSEEVSGIVCNTDNGIYYYETSGNFFPVKDVTVHYAGNDYMYEYDSEMEMYRQYTIATEAGEADIVMSGEAETADETMSEENPQQELAGSMTENELLTSLFSQEVFTFDMLEKAGLPYDMWQQYGITVGLPLYGTDAGQPNLLFEGSGYFEGKEITEDVEYYVDGNFLNIVQGYAEVAEPYWIVCVKPDAVASGWNDNLFVQAKYLVDLIYGLRYGIYIIMAASFVLGIICFVFLIAAAGHRKNTDEICETAIELLPFDVYLVLAGLTELFLLFLMAQLSYGMELLPGYLLFGMLALCMFWVALETVLTLAVRVKTKRWWTNTIICRILRWLRKGMQFFAENLPILWKVILLTGVVMVADFVTVVFAINYGGIFILLWLAEKVVLIGLILLAAVQMKQLEEGGKKIAEGDLSYQINAEKMFLNFRKHGENLNRIGEGMSRAVDERMKSERFKTELITNVSHDIKTPLTSIINYVDLLEKEELQNETAEEYLEVLERQSGRLKKLIEDLIEASKASSGALPVHKEKLEAGVFMVQTVGEFEEKTSAQNLELIIKKTEEPVYIMADGRHFWRIIDNLMNNICKYAQPSTRVYINMEEKADKAYMTFRNTSKYPLNITSEELMERFVRGDDSRNTEGSGLGLSIAKSLTELMGGDFNLYVDGDLFKVELVFPVCPKQDLGTPS